MDANKLIKSSPVFVTFVNKVFATPDAISMFV